MEIDVADTKPLQFAKYIMRKEEKLEHYKR